jgi:predicted RNA-binding Zn-ribbon protein involved in translation (DUF1610 family)
MKVIREYSTHHYEEVWEKTEYYCPMCGTREVYEEQGPRDYYAGNDAVCLACDNCFSIHEIGFHMSTLGIVEQLKTGVTTTPTTKKGN